MSALLALTMLLFSTQDVITDHAVPPNYVVTTVDARCEKIAIVLRYVRKKGDGYPVLSVENGGQAMPQVVKLLNDRLGQSFLEKVDVVSCFKRGSLSVLRWYLETNLRNNRSQVFVDFDDLGGISLQ